MIRAVTFDLWNTLLVHEYYDDRIKDARIDSVLSALTDAGYGFCRKDIFTAYDFTEKRLTEIWHTEKDLGPDGHICLLLEGLGLEPDSRLQELIWEPYTRALLYFKPLLVDGAKSLIEHLKNKGYKLGLISNTGRTPGITMRLVLEDHGLLKYFDSMIFSDEIGYIKPNRRIFEVSLKSLSIKADECAHVGDSMLLDVYGARSAGMKAIHFSKYSERFEKYAEKYYDTNGRYEKPDYVVDSLCDIARAVKTMNEI
jgi:putative hydrolase of the HAD superfamily